MSTALTRNTGSLSGILASNCCSGCGLCAGLSGGRLTMTMTQEGYLRPSEQAALEPEIDRLIGEVCPGIRLMQTAGNRADHVLWGPIVAVRLGHAADKEWRHHASSGGALSVLVNYLLSSKTVDYVVQTAASQSTPIENATVISVSPSDVYDAAGSRYAPSAPLADLSKHLDAPGRFALVGKPCDIAAVRALAQHDRRVDEKVAMMLSFFCAGVPSIKGAKAILEALGVSEADVTGFRYRGDGWPGRATATTTDGRVASMSYADSWGGILSNHLQFRCKICPDGTGGFADVVCADAWHCDEAGYPLFEEREGRSLILTRTARGEELVVNALTSGELDGEPADVSTIRAMQPSQARRKQLVLSRLAAMVTMRRPLPKFDGFNLARAAMTIGLWPQVRSFLGMARRLLADPR